MALTHKGRALYDELLAQVRRAVLAVPPPTHHRRLQQAFAQFPDTHTALRNQGLAFYRYTLSAQGQAQAETLDGNADLKH